MLQNLQVLRLARRPRRPTREDIDMKNDKRLPGRRMPAKTFRAIIAMWGASDEQIAAWFGYPVTVGRGWSKDGIIDPAVSMLLCVMARLEMGPDEIESAVRSQVGAPHVRWSFERCGQDTLAALDHADRRATRARA
jgi:hypothetical protein